MRRTGYLIDNAQHETRRAMRLVVTLDSDLSERRFAVQKTVRRNELYSDIVLPHRLRSVEKDTLSRSKNQINFCFT